MDCLKLFPHNKIPSFLIGSLSIDPGFQELPQIAYVTRTVVIATLPHSNPQTDHFERKNGHYTLTLIANPKFGLPYGSIPRILLAWMITEAVITKSPELNLGKSLSAFLKRLKLQHSGGKRGSATHVRDQMMRLLTCHISCIYYDKNKGNFEGTQYHLSKTFNLWWNPINHSSKDFITGSKIILSKDFFEEITNKPIPVDFSALNILRKSPLQLDIYVWLTYRFSFLRNETLIPWKLLKNQFGSDYADDSQGIRNFKKKFIQSLKKVWTVYPYANATPVENGLMLFQSETHVSKKKKEVSNPVDN